MNGGMFGNPFRGIAENDFHVQGRDALCATWTSEPRFYKRGHRNGIYRPLGSAVRPA